MLGQFDLRHGGQIIEVPTRAAQSLLAYLALNASVSHRREKLAGMLWPDSDEANARSYLRHALWRVRRSLDETPPASGAFLQVDDIELSFRPESPHWLDASALTIGGNPSRLTLPELEAAVALYQGELLPGFYDEWVVLEREHMQAAYTRRVKLLLDRMAEEARWDDMLELAERWIAHGRVPEAAFEAIMVAHSGLRDPGAVRSTYERAADALERELGLEPSETLETAYARLVEGQATDLTGPQAEREPASPQEVPPTPGEPPYLGLAYFDVSDAGRFFGRERLVARLVGRLREHPFLAVVVGASGSGKSSLVRAGLVPALQSGNPLVDGASPPAGSSHWHYHVITPTAHPLEALAASMTRTARSVTEAAGLMDAMAHDQRALRLFLRRQSDESNAQRKFILVDQFEETFTLCKTEAERSSFIANLLSAARPEGEAVVVIALRADFYGHCADYPELREALARHQEYIGAMNARELRQAIEEPAHNAGWEFQPGLIDLILRDVHGEPGRLPLLSHALLETWRRRSGRTMTFTGYARAGGVQRAIARTADSVYNQLLDSDQQAIARRIFLRLTGVSEGTRDTRRRALISELDTVAGGAEAVAEVLNVLADARLVTLHEDSVEMAHEALIREWPVLRRWLAEDREALQLHRHLADSALEWDRLGRDPDELYRGGRLEAALAWATGDQQLLNPTETAFLEESRALAEAEAAAQERSHRRLRLLSAGLAIVLATALAAAGLATWQSGRARAQARLATSRALLASALDSLDEDAERSILLALYAIGDADQADPSILRAGEAALREGLASSRMLARRAGGAPIALSPDGRILVTAVGNANLAVQNTETGELLHEFAPHGEDWVTTMAFSPGGARLATGSFAGEIRVWDSATWRELHVIPAHSFIVRDLSFSPDGSRLASSSNDMTGKVWRLEFGGDPAEPLQLDGHRSAVSGIAFSPDSRHLATTGEFPQVKLWDINTGGELTTLVGHELAIMAVAFSPDSRLIATVGQDHSLRLWDSTTGSAELVVENAHAGAANAVAFDPAGDYVISGGEDGVIRAWDLVTGRLLMELAGHSEAVQELAISADGGLLASAGSDGTARLWDLGEPSAGEWMRLPAHHGSANSLEYSHDGTLLATGGADGAVVVWNAKTGARLLTIEDRQDSIADVAFAPSGDQLASAGPGGNINVWDPQSGALTLRIESQNLEFLDLAYSPDGAFINALGVPRAAIYDTQSGTVDQSFSYGGNTDGEYSADGRLYAWTDRYGHIGTVLVSDPGAPEILPTLADLGTPVHAAEFSADGRRLVTAAENGLLHVWDTDPILTGPEYSTANRLVLQLDGHDGPALDAAFDPSGERIASIGLDGTLRMWDAATGVQLFVLQVDGLDVDFSPDGSSFAVARRDGMVSVFLLQLGDLADQARMRLTRGLSADECQRYLQLPSCPPLP